MGADIFPLILGQTISFLPMLIMYVQLAIIFCCVALFAATAVVGNKILEKKKATQRR